MSKEKLNELKERKLEFDVKEIDGKRYMVKVNDGSDTTLNLGKAMFGEDESFKIVGEF